MLQRNNIMLQQQQNLKGIGGWLIFVAIGIVVSPLVKITSLYKVYATFFNYKKWVMITNFDAIHHLHLSYVIAGEFIVNCIMLLLLLYLAYLFFTTKKSFPKYYVGVVITSLLVIVGDTFVVHLYTQQNEIFDRATIENIMRILIPGMIWIPYVLNSERVRATFVN